MTAPSYKLYLPYSPTIQITRIFDSFLHTNRKRSVWQRTKRQVGLALCQLKHGRSYNSKTTMRTCVLYYISGPLVIHTLYCDTKWGHTALFCAVKPNKDLYIYKLYRFKDRTAMPNEDILLSQFYCHTK